MIFVADPDSAFTLREQQILYYIAGGLSNKEIAGRLSLSEQTVKAHLSHMTTKCGRANRAALVAYGVSLHLGVEPTRFSVAIPAQSTGVFIRVAVLGVLCAVVSIVFCVVMHGAGHLMKKIKSPWLRVACGGVAVIVLTLLFGTDYNGAGMDIVTAAVEQGIVAVPWAFLLKLLFTAITLAAGFKGGEVVPSFFVGATFGCAVAPLLGLPAGFGAAVGLAAVFCGVTNCPLASTLLAVELFGAVFCTGLLLELYALRLSGPLLQPDDFVFQAEGAVYQRPHQRAPCR